MGLFREEMTLDEKLAALYLASRRVMRMRDKKQLHILQIPETEKEFVEAFTELHEALKNCED